MSNRPDPRLVLRSLAESLDVTRTLSDFPGMRREDLAQILREAAGEEPGPGAGAVLFVDGAARGNPGPAGAGIVIQWKGDPVRTGEYLGEATNNTAEYRALIAGMRRAAELGISNLEVRSDSELVVKQLNGQYRVKHPQLQDLYFQAVKAASSFRRVTFTHVRREDNREADRLANLAIDAKDSVTL